MSDRDDEPAQGSREDSRFTAEIYLYLLQELGKRGFVKMADLRKIYATEKSKDGSLYFRPLKEIIKDVEVRFWYFLKWKLSVNEDKICFVNMLKPPPNEQKISNENHRLNGILKAALMYLFVAKTPNAKDPDVLADDLMQFLEIVCSSGDKITEVESGYLKKLIAPNNKAHFVKNGWISFSKSRNENDEEIFRYDWGPNAKQNVDPMKLVELFQATTNSSTSCLTEQVKRAMDMKEHQIKMAKTGLAPFIKK
ncbi:unnamed protein product [Caenorhabditis angaria]|uniref:MAGE domain-containing protein n=1 Tax=Caenorhabditis angaria TaxID=860376 RepID=A0A9P1MU08_9PELO|nr:unnamed protein product [Caenorhabditis angaria]